MNYNFEHIGNLHIHSLYSDGSKSVPEIARLAAEAGLDFIIFNEHDYMTDGLHLEEENFYGDVLVLKGLEIGRRFHHYLAFGLKGMVHSEEHTPQEIIERVNDQGGFGFLAHPFEKGMPFHEHSVAYTWNDLSVTGFQGVCIWNFTSRWKERVRTPLHALFHLLFKVQMLKGPSTKTLSFWDRLCLERRTPAIGGSDAHGSEFQWRGLHFVPISYQFALNSINVHLLTAQPLSRDVYGAKETIYEALREGRLFIAHDNLSKARGFRYYFESQKGPSLAMGQEGVFEPGCLFMEAPLRALIRLIRNGQPINAWFGHKATYRLESKGIYRVEVYRRLPFFGWRPWIFSNPIYLR